MADPALVKAELARLAASASVETADSERDSDRHVIERAVAAVDDLEAAASFAEERGAEQLRRALDSVGPEVDRDVCRGGQRALAAFERFSRAASADDADFHPAHGIPLREEGQASDT